MRQPVYRFGWHADLWNAGPNKNATWHCACAVAWQFWTTPSDQVGLLRRLQARRCGETGGRLWKTAEVDHRIPLFRVWREYRDAPWPKLLGYWGLPNLQVINREAHVAKCSTEARDRRAAPYPASRLAQPPERIHSASFDHRFRPPTLRTAMAMAFFWPTTTQFDGVPKDKPFCSHSATIRAH
jgi:hypothetical protein